MSKRGRSPSPEEQANRQRARTRTELLNYEEYGTDEEFELEDDAPTNTGQVGQRRVINVADDDDEEELPASSAGALIARAQANRPNRTLGVADFPNVRVAPLRPPVSSQTRYNPMNDETVLTAFLLFGVFFDAGWPVELVCTLFDWVLKVFRAKEGLHLHFRSESSAAQSCPILFVNPTSSAFPKLINKDSHWLFASSFDMNHHPSLKHLTFFDFIQRTVKNLKTILFANTLSLNLGKDFFERVRNCCSAAYPGCPYYLSAMTPDLQNPYATATATVPRVHFFLEDVKDRKHSFSFCPLLFPPTVKKVFISVVIRPPVYYQRLFNSVNGYYLEDGYYDNEGFTADERKKMVELGCKKFSDKAAEIIAPGVMGIFEEPKLLSAAEPSLEAAGIRTDEGLTEGGARQRMRFFIPGTNTFTFVVE